MKVPYVLLQPPICFATMSNSDYKNDENVVVDFVHDSVIANTDPVELLLGRKLKGLGRPRIASQLFYLGHDPPLQFGLKCADLALSRIKKLYGIAQHLKGLQS